MRRLRLSLRKGSILTANNVDVGRNKLVYVLLADRKFRYPNAWSRVVYIGTTKNGISRVSQSVAKRSESIFALRGVDSFEARVITCKPRKGVKTWVKLERALLLQFRQIYGEVPVCNTQGKRMNAVDEFEYFSERGVDTILRELA